MDQYRDFTNGNLNFPVPAGQAFLDKLHAAGQHYVPIVDSNIYAPDPSNASDAYSVYDRGAAADAFIRNGNDSFYYGSNWPGFSVWTDFLVPQGQQFWTEGLTGWYEDIQYDGIWIDLSEASSFCVGSCGQYQRELNPAHPPFLLPGDPGQIDYRYPESFNVTNATEAASAISASAAQASAYPTTTLMQTSQANTVPTPGVRNLNFPPYVINNVFAGHALIKNSIAPNATHNDEYNTTEYEMHNLFGHQIVNATYHALLQVFPNRRPFIVGRSTFSGSGNITSHWGGDNTSMWGSMWFAISQALQFSIAGIPMFGTDTCGFAGNSDLELCNRWMQLSAFFPFYRNHNVISSIPQEAYRWSSVADATRTVMQIRYSILPYMYTLFYHAHESAETVMRALAWEFPDDPLLANVDTQFMLGPALLITPVLEPLVTTVQGVFPGVANGTIWYDWYTLQPLSVKSGENKTLDAPLGHINLHIKGGSILPLQEPGNTTEVSRRNPWGLLVTLDGSGKAAGDLYIDDGESLVQNATKFITVSCDNQNRRYCKC
jgi:alpha-glucosidase